MNSNNTLYNERTSGFRDKGSNFACLKRGKNNANINKNLLQFIKAELSRVRLPKNKTSMLFLGITISIIDNQQPSINISDYQARIFPAKKPKIFISYTKEDRKAVEKIIAFLKNYGCDIWTEENNLLPGQSRDSEIKKNLEQSDFFIPCLSKNSVEACGNVQMELKYAQEVSVRKPEGEIFTIPVRLDDCKMPNSISSIECVDWRDPRTKPKMLRAIGIQIIK